MAPKIRSVKTIFIFRSIMMGQGMFWGDTT